MRIAIPSESDAGLESMRSGHFGHAPYFTVVTFDDAMGVQSVESAANADHDAVGCGGVIDHAISLGLDGIIAAGMGMPPFMRFTEGGIKVYLDQSVPKVGDVVALFAEGKVAPMDPSAACRH